MSWIHTGWYQLFPYIIQSIAVKGARVEIAKASNVLKNHMLKFNGAYRSMYL